MAKVIKKKWMPYYWPIPLAEEEIPMDKGGFRSVVIDSEKVIKGLECCLGSNDCDVEPEEDCPYKGMCLCAMALRFDVLALLKEQEAVEPIPYHRSDGTIFKYECRQCRTKIFKNDLFCRHCGQAVKWE